MQLEPDVMRELHWHATAAEWAFVLKGRVRTTRDQSGRANRERTTLSRAESGIFRAPRARGLSGLGNEPTHFILIFPITVFFRVRHLQHYRLDRPRAQVAVGEKILGCLSRALTVFHARRLLRPRRDSSGAIPENLQGPRVAPPQTHKFRMLSEAPHGVFKGGPRMAR